MLYYIYIYIEREREREIQLEGIELWISLLKTSQGVNQLNYKTLGYVLFYIDYVVNLHNIHVIHVLNYTRN